MTNVNGLAQIIIQAHQASAKPSENVIEAVEIMGNHVLTTLMMGDYTELESLLSQLDAPEVELNDPGVTKASWEFYAGQLTALQRLVATQVDRLEEKHASGVLAASQSLMQTLVAIQRKPTRWVTMEALVRDKDLRMSREDIRASLTALADIGCITAEGEGRKQKVTLTARGDRWTSTEKRVLTKS